MASTLKPNDAFDLAKRYIKNMPLEQVQVRILDSINKMMWMAAPWRWSIGAMANITLASNTQDYVVAIPNDFLYAITSYSTDQAGGTPRPLSIEPVLPLGGLQGQPSRVAFSGTPGNNGNARFLPKPGTQPASPPVVISMYKKIAPVISTANMNTGGALLFDDEWFFVYESGVLWMAYMFADDSRAGSANYDSKGGYNFTGQRAIFESNLEQMKMREKLLILDPRQVPDAKADK